MKTERAVLATLVDKFGLRPWEIARLTERQIHEIYFHPRTKDGDIEWPKEESIAPDKPKHVKTYDNDLRALREFAGEVRMPKKRLIELEKKLKVKYGRDTTDTTESIAP